MLIYNDLFIWTAISLIRNDIDKRYTPKIKSIHIH